MNHTIGYQPYLSNSPAEIFYSIGSITYHRFKTNFEFQMKVIKTFDYSKMLPKKPAGT